MVRWRLLALLVAFLVAAAGCGSGTDSGGAETESGAPSDASGDGTSGVAADGVDTDGETASASEDDPDSIDEPIMVPPDGAEVVLVEAGAEPRRELRAQIEPGTSEIMIVDQNHTIEFSAGVIAGPSGGSLPIELTAAIQVSDGGDGLRRVESEIIDIGAGEGLDPVLAEGAASGLTPLIGSMTWVLIDDRGQIMDHGVEAPPDLDPTVAATLDQAMTGAELAVPLPAEPVGIGAVWQVNEQIESSGLIIDQTREFRLVGIEGNVLAMDITVEQTVEAGETMETGEVPITVISWLATGAGTMEYDLTRVVPHYVFTLEMDQELDHGSMITVSHAVIETETRPG
jgi:hypothetical protein